MWPAPLILSERRRSVCVCVCVYLYIMHNFCLFNTTGTFGIVYKGVFRQTSNIETDVAIKTLKGTHVCLYMSAYSAIPLVNGK